METHKLTISSWSVGQDRRGQTFGDVLAHYLPHNELQALLLAYGEQAKSGQSVAKRDCQSHIPPMTFLQSSQWNRTNRCQVQPTSRSTLNERECDELDKLPSLPLDQSADTGSPTGEQSETETHHSIGDANDFATRGSGDHRCARRYLYCSSRRNDYH